MTSKRTPGEKVEPNERELFLTAKDALKKNITKTCHEQGLKSSTRGLLKGLLAKLSAEQIDELAKTGETSTLVSKMEMTTNKIHALIDELKACDAQSLQPIGQKYTALCATLNEQEGEANKLLEAAKKLKASQTNERRLGGMKDRYRITKVTKLIAPGGYQPVFAKVVADAIHAGKYVEPAQALDAAQIQVYNAAIGGTDIPALVKAYQQGHCEGKLSEKANEIVEELSNHARKKTLMARLVHKNSVPDPASWLGKSSDDMHKDEGAGPWIAAIKSNIAAIGPSFSPLPCVGNFLSLVDTTSSAAADVTDEAEEPSTFLICLPMPKFIDAGLVALGDLVSFLETETGAALAKKSVAIVELKPDIVCWVPWGTLCVPLILHDGKDMKVKAIWTVPAFSKALVGQLCTKHRGPINTWNTEFLQKYSGQVPFKKRLDAYNKLQAAA